MNYTLGEAKDLADITKDDVLEHYVWLYVWEADLEKDYSEDWQVPVLGITNISNEFSLPSITLKEEKSGAILSGSFDYKTKCLEDIAIWNEDEWQCLSKTSLMSPLVLESLIMIDGKENVRFIMEDLSSEKAYMEGFSKNDKKSRKAWWKFW